MIWTELDERLAVVGIVRKIRSGQAGARGEHRTKWECPLCGRSHPTWSNTGKHHLQRLEEAKHAIADREVSMPCTCGDHHKIGWFMDRWKPR